MHNVREARGSAAAHVGEAPGGNAHAQRRAEHAGRHVGQSIGAQLAVGVSGLEGSVPAAEVLHHSRGDQQVDGSNQGQGERSGKYGDHISRRPGEPGTSNAPRIPG